MWVGRIRHARMILLLNDGVPVMNEEKQETKFSQTLGGHFSTALGKLNLASNLYYQMGKHVSGKEIRGLNFLMEVSLKNDISGGFEHLSGTSYNETSKIKSFTPFYGTNHKFNGFMDYFYVGNHMGSVGLNDIYLKYKYTKNKFGFNADLHYFGAAADISANADNYLGTELDLSISWVVKPTAKLVAGWSMLLAGDSMEILKGGDSSVRQSWGYIMLSVTPSFIK